MIWVSIIIMIIVLIIGLFSAAGLHVGILQKRFFGVFHPVRFLLNVRDGIEKLKCLNGQIVNSKGREHKASTVQRGDKGFEELVRFLNENFGVGSTVDKIHLSEQPAPYQSRISPAVSQVLVFEEDRKLKHVLTDPFDPAKPIRDLNNWAEDTFRKYLAHWALVMLTIWLIANSYMLYLLNS